MSTHRWIAALCIVSGFTTTGCASAPKLPVFGTWRVQASSAPGQSAQSVQALAWVGVSASFGTDDARVGGDRCSLPRDTSRSLSSAEFQQEYHTPPATLGITSEPVTVYRLDCGYDWGGTTNTLIVKSPTSLLTPSGGVFLELVKAPPAIK